MPAAQRVVTPCKVNLHLGVHAEKDAKGYHRVDSIMLAVAPCDTVAVEDAPALAVTHEPPLLVPAEKTTTWRAALLLAEALGKKPGVAVRVACEIPEKAGLGGSSADAGAVLRVLAARWGVDPLDPHVVAVARRVGADVAFFLDPGRPALMVGAGDELRETFPELAGVPIVLVMPPGEGGSTKAAYDEFDRDPADPGSYEPMCRALRAGDVAAIAANLRNNLAPAAERLMPAMGEAERWLHAQPGVLGAQVSGSGSCSFAICESAQVADRIAREARDVHDWWARATFSLGAEGKFC